MSPTLHERSFEALREVYAAVRKEEPILDLYRVIDHWSESPPMGANADWNTEEDQDGILMQYIVMQHMVAHRRILTEIQNFLTVVEATGGDETILADLLNSGKITPNSRIEDLLNEIKQVKAEVPDTVDELLGMSNEDIKEPTPDELVRERKVGSVQHSAIVQLEALRFLLAFEQEDEAVMDAMIEEDGYHVISGLASILYKIIESNSEGSVEEWLMARGREAHAILHQDEDEQIKFYDEFFKED